MWAVISASVCTSLSHSTKTQKCLTSTPQVEILERADYYKYLGLLLTSDFSWSSHIHNICAKARKLLGLTYRHYYQHADSNTLLQIYIALVRPHLEYASPVWSPHLSKDINSIEDVQKFALRICAKSWED